jgi:hypothetical protein
MTVKTLEVVEFIEALESVDGNVRGRFSPSNQKTILARSGVRRWPFLCH